MDEHEFYEQVQDRADFDDEEDAIAITHATLQTLSQRISEEQARDLAQHLADPLGDSLTESHGHPETFDREAFFDRIGNHEGVNAAIEDRDERVEAVLGTLADAVGDESFTDMRNQLPSDFEELFDLAETERDIEQ